MSEVTSDAPPIVPDGGALSETGSATSEVDSVQAGARWLIGGAAAVLAVLGAGVQLSDLGDLAAKGPVERAWTIGLCLAALGAVGTILVLAARVLVHPGWTLARITHEEQKRTWNRHWLSGELDAHRGFLAPDVHDSAAPAASQGPGIPQVSPERLAEAISRPALRAGRLYGHQSDLLRAWFELHEQGKTKVTGSFLDSRSTTQTEYVLGAPNQVSWLQQRLANTASAAARVASLANLLDTRRRYRRLVRWQLPVLGSVAVTGVLGLIWLLAVNADVPVQTPMQVDVHFTASDEYLKAHNVPTACKNHPVRAVAINGSFSSPVVVSGDPQCTLPQMEVSPEAGFAVPVVSPSK